MADEADSKSVAGDRVRVQVPLPAVDNSLDLNKRYEKYIAMIRDVFFRIYTIIVAHFVYL